MAAIVLGLLPLVSITSYSVIVSLKGDHLQDGIQVGSIMYLGKHHELEPNVYKYLDISQTTGIYPDISLTTKPLMLRQFKVIVSLDSLYRAWYPLILYIELSKIFNCGLYFRR